MRLPESKPKFDENWSWPRKTWLQERLTIVREREQEMGRRTGAASKNPPAVENKPENGNAAEEG